MLSEFSYVYNILNRTNNPIPIHNVKMKLCLLVSNTTVANKERNDIVNIRRLQHIELRNICCSRITIERVAW